MAQDQKQKHMTDTPRTDNYINGNAELKLGGNALKYARVESEFARQLERENKQLERLGNELCDWLEVLEETYMQHLCLHQRRILRQDIKNWKEFNISNRKAIQ